MSYQVKTIFIGPFGNGNVPKDGASIKNYHILNRLRAFIPELIAIDTDNWKRRPMMLLKLLLTIIFNHKGRYILSLNNDSAHKVIKIIHTLTPQAQVIYWVIGGSLGKWMAEGRLEAKDFAHLRHIIVEGETMKSQLESCGLDNAIVMPNFKKITIVEKPGRKSKKVRLIFLSRIIREKGCDLILDAAAMLNREGLGQSYEIGFYGPIAPEYALDFNGKIKGLENVGYKGFLDLRQSRNYTELAGYDAMLFPTFWPGEGCPGIVIDAFMSGLPILASDWNMNRDYIENGRNGILFKARDLQALTDTMRSAITGEYDLAGMAKRASESAAKYDIETVLSTANLRRLEIID